MIVEYWPNQDRPDLAHRIAYRDVVESDGIGYGVDVLREGYGTWTLRRLYDIGDTQHVKELRQFHGSWADAVEVLDNAAAGLRGYAVPAAVAA